MCNTLRYVASSSDCATPHKEAVESKHPENEGLNKREPGTNQKWVRQIHPGKDFRFRILESGTGISS